MKLVGMLDSPYVRRVAISLELYGVDFVHEPLVCVQHLQRICADQPRGQGPHPWCWTMAPC